MNFKKMGLALAVAASATSANAAFQLGTDDAGNTSGSSLLFAAYDETAATALYVDLDVFLRQFDENTTLTYDLTTAAANSGVNLTGATWTVVGSDRTFGGGNCVTGGDASACGVAYATTIASGETPLSSYASAATSQTAGSVDNNWHLPADQQGIDGNGYLAIADGNSGAWITGAVPSGNLWSNLGTAGETLGFAIAETTGVGGNRGFRESDTATTTTFAGTWTLAADGSSLEYTAVPVPAAVWMFASGLVGLAGVARRRKQA